MRELEEPILKLSPTQNKMYLIIEKHLGTFAVFIFLLFISYQSDSFKYILFATIVYLCYIIINTIMTIRKWKKVSYLFYEDRVVLVENKKGPQEFYYKELEDILMMQSRVQRFFNIGYFRLKKVDGNILSKNVDLKPVDKYDEVITKMTHGVSM